MTTPPRHPAGPPPADLVPGQPTGIFLVAVPGLEQPTADEAAAAGFADVVRVPGGVTLRGGWPEVWRANLELRGPSRILARVGSFRAMHLAQLDKRARRFPWAQVLRPDIPVRVEAATHASRIYHAGAATERVARAIHEELGAPIATGAGGVQPINIKVRIDDDLVTISVDTSGEGLHKRGHKLQVNKAPLRETMAAMILRQCGFDGAGVVLDPMCGSGTLVIEAAEIAAGLAPGRSRGFAFERLASFDPAAWAALRAGRLAAATGGNGLPLPRFHGSDRDAGAVAMARDNAGRAGVAAACDFRQLAISDLTPPAGPAGLVIANPPYGTRIGERRPLFGLYGAFGRVMSDRFAGWRVAILTADSGLAQATGLPFLPPGPPILHGGIKVTLWQTGPLGQDAAARPVAPY